ncbi:archaemetzincin [Enhygromyxa salina]|uniref:Peptidase family M54 n=1 Tax=Enhygromyxa salina TaxID=215803 RepID=A0A2S9YSM5_9BACT|nr:archaemetzincin [Enhygromyxa salina]PRQ08052.1 Peptidase family M54 [Enhygromyxa salina]
MRRREFLILALGVGACERAKPELAARDDAPELPTAAPAPAPASPLGSLDDIPAVLRPAFSLTGHAPPPRSVTASGEPPQSFAEFLAEHPPRPRPDARTIAILPIGEYPRGFVVEYDAVRLVRSPEPELLARFISAWFGLPTTILPAMTDEPLERLPARELDGRRQLDAAALLEWVRQRRPADATCVVALTLEDLYAEDAAWVFGYASVDKRVGVHSMLRYDPGFDDTEARGPAFEATIRARALRVLAHEVAHMFGLRHCVHFHCLMNATAGIADIDRAPLHLCPVCLRKLWVVSGVSLVERWQRLAELCDELEQPQECAWFDACLRLLGVG